MKLIIFCVLNAMQMDVYIADGCLFATGMRMGCDCWETSLQRGALLCVQKELSDFKFEF